VRIVGIPDAAMVALSIVCIVHNSKQNGCACWMKGSVMKGSVAEKSPPWPAPDVSLVPYELASILPKCPCYMPLACFFVKPHLFIIVCAARAVDLVQRFLQRLSHHAGGNV
jgi:hypothetical protein